MFDSLVKKIFSANAALVPPLPAQFDQTDLQQVYVGHPLAARVGIRR